MPKTLTFALVGLVAAAATAATAAPVRGLYEVAVLVTDQTPAARKQAFGEALQAVLVRITGSRTLPQEPAAQPILSRAPALVVGYGYESASGGSLLLRARFDPRAVEAAVRKQGLPVWGDNRPTHLVWVATQDGRTRSLVDNAGAATRAGGLLAAAEARGLLLSFPAMDATDKQMVSFHDVWEGRYEGLAAASRRYAMDQVVVVRAVREGGQWVTRWAVLDSGTVSDQWSRTESSLDHALAEGLHALADREARQFASHSAGGIADLVLEISGVRSLQDYSRALRYLRGLNAVTTAHIERVEGETVTYRLAVQGNPDIVLRAIASGRTLQRQPEQERLFSSNLSYELVR